MGAFSFGIDQSALWIMIGIFLLSGLIKLLFFQSSTPYLFYSNLKNFPFKQEKTKWAALPFWLYLSTLSCFVLAFIDPYFVIPPQRQTIEQRQTLPKKGIAIYLVLDQSGSMSQSVNRSETKMDLLKQVTQRFIASRPSDLIGLVAFARIPEVLSPLTLDKKLLQDQLNHLQVVQSKDRDGTAMGYAIFKTAHLIAATKYFAQELSDQAKPAYEIKNTVMIVVTDGLQDPNPLDKGNRLRTLELEDAADYATQEGIRLYIVNIDPKFAQDQFAPHRRQLDKITRQTGGQFFLVNAQQDLQQIYATIDQIEKEAIPFASIRKPPEQQWHLAPLLLSLGLACFCFGFLLSSTRFKQVP